MKQREQGSIMNEALWGNHDPVKIFLGQEPFADTETEYIIQFFFTDAIIFQFAYGERAMIGGDGHVF